MQIIYKNVINLINITFSPSQIAIAELYFIIIVNKIRARSPYSKTRP